MGRVRELRCSACKQSKPRDQFHNDVRYKSGKASRCKPCAYQATQDWRTRNHDELLAARRDAYSPEEWFRHNLKSRYSMSEQDYQGLLSGQSGVCAVCGEKCPSGKKLAVDHDHSCCPGRKSCGKCIRGLLCSRCNTGIGSFRDRADLLLSAANYIEREE